MTEAQPTPIKVGIAALGRSGWGIHANALSHLPDHYQIVAVADIDEVRQQEAKDRFGCRAYTDYADLVADDEIELMVVATPSQLHAEHTVAALQAGQHVIVEKPMAHDLAGVDQMIAAAKESGKILTVNQNYRYHNDYLKIKEVIDSGVLGRIIQINFAGNRFARRWDWQTLKKYGGGELNNKGAHTVDWAMLMIDDPEPEILCQMETTPLYAGDAESHVKLILKPKPGLGPIIDIELSNACAYPTYPCLVMGTQGSLIHQGNEIRWKYYVPEEVPPLVLDTQPTPDRSYNREDLPMHEEVHQLERNFGGGVVDLYRDLYATIRDGTPLVITPESVRRQVVVLERCRQSSPVYNPEA